MTLLNHKSSFKVMRGKSAVAESALSLYTYKGIGIDGAATTGSLSAKSRTEARFVLERNGVSNISVANSKRWYDMEFGRPVSLEVLLQVTRQLASFSEAGIPVAKGISILSETTENKRMAEILEEILMDVEGGAQLSDAVKQYPNVFPRYYSAILNSAERSGNLTEALSTLNSYLERDLRSKRAVRSAMVYPAVLIALTLLAVVVLSVFVLPRFQVFFDSLSVKLPLTTRMLLAVTHFVQNWWWAFVVLGVLAGIGLFFMRRAPKGRLKLDQIMLKLPVAGPLIELVALERFCRVLSTLVRTQVSLPDALELAGSSTGNRVFEDAITQARMRVIQGEGLAAPLERANIFPAAAVQIFRIGEESGQLGSQLSQAASFYSDELDHRLKNFTALLEPATLIVIGGGVGFVAIALVSAMYGIYSGVRG
ncbi:MAG: type II secretion system F family protein [Actinomycetes bacterium]